MDQNDTKSNTGHLFLAAKSIEAKLDKNQVDDSDFLRLAVLAEQFTSSGLVRESLFCIKLQVKYLFQLYWRNNSVSDGIVILEDAHDLAIDLISHSESKGTLAPSFYKAFLKVKLELARVKRSLGFLDEALALEQCAERIRIKARKLFPMYQKFNN